MTTKPSPAAALTDVEVVAGYAAGTLLSTLQRPLDSTGQEALQVQLAALHNRGDVDLLTLTTSPEFQSLERRHFFSIQQLYCGVIPRLDASPLVMLQSVRRLVTQAGNDGFAALLHGAVCRWIDRVPGRASEIIALAKSDPDVAPEVLRGALVTLGDQETVKFFLAVIDARRQAAIAALGAIRPKDQGAADEALAELVAIAAADANDDMRLTAMLAAFNLLHDGETEATRWVPRLIATVTSALSDTTRIALLQCLWRHTALFSFADVKTTLAVVVSGGDLPSQHLIGTLDATLSHLLEGPYYDLAIDCLTDLLSNGKALALERLQSVKYRLAGMDRTRLLKLAVRWFGTRDPKLCEATSELVSGLQQAQPFDASLAGYGLSGNQVIAVCHKAVGYLLLEPVVAASFLVAALRMGDCAIESELTELLFQILLVNYGEMVVAYLKGLVKTDMAYPPIRKALKRYQTYEKALRIESPIKELLPSSYQRGVARQMHYVEGQEIRKQAARHSIFHGLMHRSNLIYGRKAITYAAGPDKPPVSMELKTIRTGLAMPRLQLLDPVGLDWLTRIFRMSKPK